MGSWVFLLVIVIAVIKYAAKGFSKEETKDTRPPAAPIQTVGAQKREQMARVEQWRAAKAQQDDARQMHAINMDSCESKLESLRVLYDAGILDREEYAQRVARVKSRHAHGTR